MSDIIMSLNNVLIDADKLLKEEFILDDFNFREKTEEEKALEFDRHSNQRATIIPQRQYYSSGMTYSVPDLNFQVDSVSSNGEEYQNELRQQLEIDRTMYSRTDIDNRYTSDETLIDKMKRLFKGE